MCQGDLLAPHTPCVHGVAEVRVPRADDVDLIWIWRIHKTELKVFFSGVTEKTTHIAGDGERRAHHAIQRPSLNLGVHSGVSCVKHRQKKEC